MFWRSTWPAFVWALIVLILCGIPGNDLPKLTFLEWLNPDKIVHLILFGTQSFLLIHGFQKQISYSFLNRNSISASIIITVLFGCLVEVLQDQIFINRSGDFRDAIANAIGAFTGWWFYRKKFKVKTLFL